MQFSKCLAVALLVALSLAGCSGKQYPADSSEVKYANRGNPGAKLQVKSLLTPDEMNLIYFYADW